MRESSAGEHQAQAMFGTGRRALAFYNKQMLDYLNGPMRDFIAQCDSVFISTADSGGECDCSFRAGPRGFVQSLNDRTLIYPEYRGNGVLASVGNVLGNPHIGMLFIDFVQHSIGLHANGSAEILETDEAARRFGHELAMQLDPKSGRRPELWVLVTVSEAYIHCSKHIPRYSETHKAIHWGTDDDLRKGGDFFKAKDCPRS
jgi:predicted pyridoxine 5'-phosphate oxidase superfamily flavin-nucleotide-binding protein